MDYEQILYEKSDGVATITLNRPERMNAFTDVMIREWAAALEDARLDRDVRAVDRHRRGPRVLRGRRPARRLRHRQNIAQDDGAAVGRRPAQLAARRRPLRAARRRSCSTSRTSRAVNGAAVGAGMDMAVMADIRIASEQARSSRCRYVKVGLVPGDGGCYYLPRIVGLAKALELIWTGDFFDAQEALRIGYVSKRRARGRADAGGARARAAHRAGAGGGDAAREAARLSRPRRRRGTRRSRWPGSAMAIVQSTEDAREGPRAFVEARPPKFLGR